MTWVNSSLKEYLRTQHPQKIIDYSKINQRMRANGVRLYKCDMCGYLKNANHFKKAARKERGLICIECLLKLVDMDGRKPCCCIVCGTYTKRKNIPYCQDCLNKYGYLITVNIDGRICLDCGKYEIDGKSFYKTGMRCRKCKAAFLKTDRGRDQKAKSRGNSTRAYSARVFKRDNYTCKCCGERGSKLNAHHLESYKLNPDKRETIRNAITLCENCHREYHSWNGGTRVPATKESFEQFIKEKTCN